MEQELTAPPRIVFLSSGGIFGDIVLRRLLESGKFDVVGIVRSRRVMLRGAGFLRGAAAYFARCGILYTVYIWLITTFAEFLGLFTGHGSITARAKKRSIPVLHTRDVNSEEGRQFLDRCHPDILVTAHFDQRLYPPLCDSAQRAVVNLHPSLLPAHRGLEPVLHSMKSRETDFGVTLHRLVEHIDSGPVLASARHQASNRESALRVTQRLFALGADLLIACPPTQLGPGKGAPQTSPGTYHSWPTGRDVFQLYRSGKHLLKPNDVPLFWRND